MTTQPSDWAVAAAFRHFVAGPANWNLHTGEDFISAVDRLSRELDATRSAGARDGLSDEAIRRARDIADFIGGKCTNEEAGKKALGWFVQYGRSMIASVTLAPVARELDASGPEPAAFCQPDNPDAKSAFSWPGTARNPAHTRSLYATPRAAEAATTNSAQISSSLVVGEALDAARYRWLKAQNAITETPDAWTITRCDFTDEEEPIRYWVGDDLDAAIDAAMGAVGAGGGDV